MIHKTIKMSCFALLLPGMLYAQNVKKLTLQEAIQLGIENSKNLKLSQNKIEEALAKLDVTKDNSLPTAKASVLYNHAEIPANQLVLDGGNPIFLPKRANAFVGTASVQQLVYGGVKMRYEICETKH
ncbi:TolC family protein [Pedobacter sp. NJ-S-72]